MVLSHVQTDTPMAIVRASAWANSLSRMGVHLPLFLVHDIGVMLSLSRGAGGYVLRPRESQLARIQMPANAKPQLDQYRRLLENIAQIGHLHFEMLGLGYGAYLTFGNFCRERFPEISDQVVAQMVAGIDILLFRPDDELKKLAEDVQGDVHDAIAVHADVGRPHSAAAAEAPAAGTTPSPFKLGQH